MLSILTYAHAQSLASLVGFSSTAPPPSPPLCVLRDSPSSSPSPLASFSLPSPPPSPPPPVVAETYFSALRELLVEMAASAVTVIKSYSQLAARYIPGGVTAALDSVVPAELTRAVRLFVSLDDGKAPPPPPPPPVAPRAINPTPPPPSFVCAASIDAVEPEQKPIADDAELETKEPSSATLPVETPTPLPALDSAVAAPEPHVIPSVTESAAGGLSVSASPIPTLRSIHPARSTVKQNLSQLLDASQDILVNNESDPDSLTMEDLIPVTRHLGMSIYANSLLYNLAALYKNPFETTPDDAADGILVVSWTDVVKIWRKAYLSARGDIDVVIFHLISMAHPNRGYLMPMDFEPIVREVVLIHPAFEFLRAPSSFQDRYVETVLAQLFTIRPIHSHRVSLRDYRKAGLLDLLTRVEQAAVCLGFQIPPQFSYKSFYVIYCKFWKLDEGGREGGPRDMLLTSADLERYCQGALTPLVCQRVVDLYGSARVLVATPPHQDDIMHLYEKHEREERALTFMDFVRFIRATEDKTAPESIAYWFEVLDLEQDGRISLLELETVWAWQEERLLMFEDYTFPALLSVIWDTLNLDQSHTSLLLADLRREPVAAGMVFELLFDARGREVWLRRTADPSFRAEQTVCVALEDGDGLCDEYAEMGHEPLLADARQLIQQHSRSGSGGSGDVAKRKVWLTGWPRFVELAYRDLLGGEDVADDDVER
ncbi:Serine/threonine-protein phosphatase 2A regulatory subunit B'' subunit beta [Geranomyces variabilis]|uniref:Serine/threonine-protein phosphatase 2A regulatory subunit B'' subunit beta n=1 Tax=Geranomyces variabilis TaxID=109894 RepID=A0AAD5TP12_9FUNG|nr:Serine/threonine-protein phosphatase 2A regulatory subunit B'' subunit beta [Geranomyces variabilis]